MMENETIRHLKRRCLTMFIFALLPLLIYIAVIVFAIWYLMRFLNVQTERNEILKDISAKLDKKKDEWQGGSEPFYGLEEHILSTRAYLKEFASMLFIFIVNFLIRPFVPIWFKVLMDATLLLAFVLITSAFVLSLIQAKKNSWNDLLGMCISGDYRIFYSWCHICSLSVFHYLFHHRFQTAQLGKWDSLWHHPNSHHYWFSHQWMAVVT